MDSGFDRGSLDLRSVDSISRRVSLSMDIMEGSAVPCLTESTNHLSGMFGLRDSPRVGLIGGSVMPGFRSSVVMGAGCSATTHKWFSSALTDEPSVSVTVYTFLGCSCGKVFNTICDLPDTVQMTSPICSLPIGLNPVGVRTREERG